MFYEAILSHLPATQMIPEICNFQNASQEKLKISKDAAKRENATLNPVGLRITTPQESGLPPPNSVSFDFRSKGEQISTEPVRQLPSTLEALLMMENIWTIILKSRVW